MDDLFAAMSAADSLTRRAYHFGEHGKLLGASSAAEYEALFRQHVRRFELRCFTSLRVRDGSRMWYLVAIDSGAVAQYTESRGRYWSFFRPASPRLFLESGRGWWVEVSRSWRGWEFTPW